MKPKKYWLIIGIVTMLISYFLLFLGRVYPNIYQNIVFSVLFYGFVKIPMVFAFMFLIFFSIVPSPSDLLGRIFEVVYFAITSVLCFMPGAFIGWLYGKIISRKSV